MDKHTATLLLIACLLLATQARCRIIEDGGEKINLPYGLCVHDVKSYACKGERCYCCTVGVEVCYLSMDECTKECKKLGAQPPAGGGGGNTSPIA